jgi:hypothetical protein
VSPRIEDLAAPLLWVGVAVGAVLARRRVLGVYRSTVAVLLPVAVFAVLELLLSLDGLIPGAR